MSFLTNEEVYTSKCILNSHLDNIRWFMGHNERKYGAYVYGKYLQYINYSDLNNLQYIPDLSKDKLDNIWQGWCAKGNKHQTDYLANILNNQVDCLIDKFNNQIKQKDNEILQQAKQINQQHEQIKQLSNRINQQNIAQKNKRNKYCIYLLK